jgi:C1A family cysteine protease
MDCSKERPYLGKGCNGGRISSAYQYIVDKMVVPENEYYFVGFDQPCKKRNGKFNLTSFYKAYYENGDCAALTSHITKEPTTVMIDATNWRLYKSGIFDDCGTILNHAVQLVGVVQNFKNSENYWLVKNSWSKFWG